MRNATVSDVNSNGTNTPTTSADPSDHSPALAHIDPRDLLVDANVRTDVRLDKDFLASIREHGVLVPIVAVRTTDGPLRVRFGQRRTLAAIEGERPTVPVVIAGDEATDDDATIDRLVTQYAENEHRTGLTTTERIQVAAQLSLLGVSAAQITKRIRMPRREVDAALTVAGSDLATAAASRYDFLDLTQAAAVAEFEDDTDTVKALVVAAQTGQFDHALQKARDARLDAQRREDFAQQVRDTGVPVIDSPDVDGPVRRLHRLLDADGQPLTVDTHAKCPGHAAYLMEKWGYIDPTTGQPPAQGPDHDQDDDEQDDDGVATKWGQYLAVGYCCNDYVANGHREPSYASTGSDRPRAADLSPEQQEQARAARRDVIESNKAWRSAESVRREWLRTFLTRKTAPKGASVFVAVALARHAATVISADGNSLAADLLGSATGHGSRNDLADLAAKATDARAQVLTLAQVLAAYEAATNVSSWRQVSDGTRRYLEFIAANGYTLSDVERRACGQEPLPHND